MHKKIQRDNKTLQLIIVLVLVIALVVSGVLWIGRLLDARKFADISRDKDVVAEGLVNHLGAAVESYGSRDICFNTNQGPYNNGKLWCQVATVIRLNTDVDQRSVATKFTDMAKDANLSVQVDDSNHWFQSSRGVSCRYMAISTIGDELGSATARPFDSGDAPAIAVACADRAKAKHYPYIDS